jgi:hypothetical protein
MRERERERKREKEGEREKVEDFSFFTYTNCDTNARHYAARNGGGSFSCAATAI